MMQNLRMISLLLLFFCFALSGCDEREAYSRGYKAGSEVRNSISYKQGYETGYREGFERGRPSTPIKLSGTALTFYKILIWGGALKIIVSLLIAGLALLNNSDSPHEIAGKIIFSVLGAAVTIVLVIYFSLSDVVVSGLLSPGPSLLFWQIVLLGFAGTCMYVFLEFLFKICSASSHRPKTEAWLIAIIASLVCLLIPVLELFATRVPDVAGYFGGNVFAGSLLGGLYWLGSAALNRRFSPLIDAQRK